MALAEKQELVTHRISVPKTILPSYGGLEISSSASALPAAHEATTYLKEYPYECTEQLSSRIIGAYAMIGVGAGSTKEVDKDLKKQIAKHVKVLKTRQAWNGGFGFWSNGTSKEPLHRSRCFWLTFLGSLI
jgi:uncharacterized protein YfaS (alpha-2-macroglobulin family)